jgi:hypothetical protein
MYETSDGNTGEINAGWMVKQQRSSKADISIRLNKKAV